MNRQTHRIWVQLRRCGTRWVQSGARGLNPSRVCATEPQTK